MPVPVSLDFLKTMQAIPVLSPEHEYALGLRCKARDREACNTLVEHNLRLVYVCLARMGLFERYPSFADDLLQEGFLGLLHAAEKFDPTHGRFTTYAWAWIRQYVSRAIPSYEAIRLAHYIWEERQRLNHHYRIYEQKYGTPPSDADLARELQMEQEQVCLLRNLNYTYLSLDGLDYGDNEEMSLHDMLPDDEDFTEQFDQEEEQKEKRHRIEQAFRHANLDERERAILELRYGQGKTYRAIGHQFGISHERVRQICEYTLRRLRQGTASHRPRMPLSPTQQAALEELRRVGISSPS